MTDPEKQALSEQIATLAEQAGVDVGLLWETAGMCPSGHENSDKTLAVGSVCNRCVLRCTRNLQEEYRMHQFLREYPDLCPEYRFGKQPRAMTDPTTLMRVIDAWRMLDGMESDVTIITNFSYAGFDDQYSTCFMLGAAGHRVYPTRKASSVGEAFALAFLAVLVGEEDPRWRCDEDDEDDEKEGLS